MAHSDKLIHSILVGGVEYEIHDAHAIHTIEDLNLSSVLKFGGVVPTRTDLPAASADTEGYVYHIKDEDTEVVCVEVDGVYHWEDFGHAIVTDHVHDVVVTPSSTTEASKIVTPGEVKAGTLPSYSEGTFNPGRFEQGQDEFNAGSFEPGSVDLAYTAPTFEQGTDTFQTNTPTTIDVSKFNAGSLTQTDISYEAPTLTDCQLVQSVSNGVLSFSLTPGSLTGGGVTGGKVSYTAPSLEAGFYTAGSAASFEQGTDTFTAGSASISETPAEWIAPTFKQGEDTYVAPTKAADTFDAGAHVQVTLPTFTAVNNLWNSVNASGTTAKPKQAD